MANITGISSQAAFTVTGPNEEGLVATLSLANPLTVAPVVTLNGADFMTLQYLTFTGGQYGLLVENNSNNLTAGFLNFTANSVDGLLVENSPALSLENSSASHNTQVGIHVISGSNVLAMSNITAFANGTYGLYVDGQIPLVYGVIATYNGNDGIYLTDVASVEIEASTASDNGGSGIYVNETGGSQAVIGDIDLAQNLGNVVANNIADGILTYGNVLVAGNVVSGSTAVNTAGIYLNYAGTVANNDVFGNNNGIITFASNSPMYGNRVYNNVNAGISTSEASPVYDNVAYSNGVGIEAGSNYSSYSAEINNNLVYANANQGILVEDSSSGGTQIVNNTVYEPLGDGVDIQETSTNVQLPQQYHLGAVGLRHLRGRRQPDGLRQRLQHSLHQRQRAGRPLAADCPPHLGRLAERRFHRRRQPLLESGIRQHCRRRLPRAEPAGQLPRRRSGSRSQRKHGAAGLPRSHADCRRQRVAGHRHAAAPATATPTNRCPTAGTSTSAFSATRPRPRSVPCSICWSLIRRGGEVWPEGQTFNITWHFALAPVNGSTPPAGTVDINLLQVGSSTPVLKIASGVANNGQYSWTLPNSITPGSNYLVQVSSDQYAGLSATSAQPFTIPAAVHTYYINDGTVNPGDWTTAPGNDSNDGLTPGTPKASISGVLAAYHLNSGDVIMVDAGTYNLNNILVLNAAASGIVIEGYNGVNYPASQAVFNRGLSTSDVIDVNGATNLTLEDLTITGGAIGVDALDSSGSTGLTINNCVIYDNSSAGIHIGSADNSAQVTNNVVYG